MTSPALETTIKKPALKLDYTLTGVNATLAIEKGLAEADWYQCAVPRGTMRQLLERRDGPAIRNTILWFTLIIAFGYATCALWGHWWAVLPYACYSVLYASSSDSRWHETGHGTAFRTDWMNNALYEIASFMVMRESTVWRWSHTRHHSDTIIVGRDPEIAVPRPTDIRAVFMAFFNLNVYVSYFRHIVLHAGGHLSPHEKAFIPETEYSRIARNARIYLAIYGLVLVCAISLHSILPLMLVGLTNLFGSWLMVVYGLTQHAGLAENVLDHRLNCRTVYMSPVNRFLYLNMNFHIEHHMYPLVPYHTLPHLHQIVKADCPPPYPSLFAAWREIIPTLLIQRKDPAYHVKRVLPAKKTAASGAERTEAAVQDAEGWVTVGPSTDLGRADVIRFDYKRKTYAIYRDEDDHLYATDGMCTHGNVHLSEGLVKGGTIECSKHNGRFHLIDGSPARTPICRALATYPVEVRDDVLLINVTQPGGAGARAQKQWTFRVKTTRSVATFIKEITLETVHPQERTAFLPGDYLQFDIPAYKTIYFRDFDIPEPYATVWRTQHVFDLVAHNPDAAQRNNYSLANNQFTEDTLRFNVRIATPPPGQECSPGVGSSYLFSLKPGDEITAVGPFGDFHVKPTQREMVYIGGGAGMAPLRAHISHLLETEHTARKISFWYGARSKQELFYEDYFQSLADRHKNFSFHVALSSPLPEEAWGGLTGFIHEVLLENYLRDHGNPAGAEFYLCGPPMMIKACTRTLADLNVPATQISYDEF